MDAVCGPSNALQNFQKHAQQDRTLQQDRLNVRQDVSQGFRSSPGPNAGLMDPEFEAFQAGISTGPAHIEPAPMQHFAPIPIQQSQFQPQAAVPDWAADFQTSLAPMRPSSSHQIAAPVPIHAPVAQNATSWHTDFLQSQNMPVTQSFAPAAPAWVHDTQMSMGYNPMMSSMAPGLGLSNIAQGKQREQQPQDMFDMSAFEKAFDDARLQMLEAEAVLQQQQEHQAEATVLDDAELSDLERELQEETDMLAERAAREMEWQTSRQGSPLANQAAWPDTFMAEQHRVLDEASSDGREAIGEMEQGPKPLDNVQDDNELSIVAGQLLDSVSDNLSEKFQASSFLQLMRRLRDKELRVEGENFVETGTSTRTASPAMVSAPTFVPQTVLDRSERIAAALADLDSDPDFMDDDSDLFRDIPAPGTPTLESVEDVVVLDIPSRIPTPEIDPPAPTLDEWRARVLGTPEPPSVSSFNAFDAINPFGF